MLSALFSSLPVSFIYYRLTRASSRIQSFLLCRPRIRSTLFSSPHLLLSYHLSHPSSSLLSSCVLFSSLIHYILSSPRFPYLLFPSLLFLLTLSFCSLRQKQRHRLGAGAAAEAEAEAMACRGRGKGICNDRCRGKCKARARGSGRGRGRGR